MATIEGLLGQVARLREQIPLKADPAQWNLMLQGDDPIPAEVARRIKPGDRVYVRRIHANWGPPDGPCLGWKTSLTGKGPVEILYREGYSGEKPTV